jgi:uncharacterized protein (TIGR02466 family)
MKTELIFPTPIWKFDNVGIDRERVIDFVDVVRTEDPKGRKSSNEGGWQSWDFIDSVMDNNPLKQLRDSIMERAYAAADEFGFNNYSLGMINLWINVNSKGDFNQLHTHPGGVLSGVYYLKLPSCCYGNLTFVRDLQYTFMKEFWGDGTNVNHSEDMNNVEHDIFPQEDQMVIFPAWLPHTVSKSAGEGDRISISFNITAYSDYYHEIYPSSKSAKS